MMKSNREIQITLKSSRRYMAIAFNLLSATDVSNLIKHHDYQIVQAGSRIENPYIQHMQ